MSTSTKRPLGNRPRHETIKRQERGHLVIFVEVLSPSLSLFIRTARHRRGEESVVSAVDVRGPNGRPPSRSPSRMEGRKIGRQAGRQRRTRTSRSSAVGVRGRQPAAAGRQIGRETSSSVGARQSAGRGLASKQQQNNNNNGIHNIVCSKQ